MRAVMPVLLTMRAQIRVAIVLNQVCYILLTSVSNVKSQRLWYEINKCMIHTIKTAPTQTGKRL